MDSFEKVKAEKIHLTLTLGEVDVLVKAGQLALFKFRDNANDQTRLLAIALQKLDEAVNL